MFMVVVARFLVIFGNFILQVVEALRDFQKISLQKI